MDVFYWYLASNLIWTVIILTMVKIKASWFELVIVAIVVNLVGLASAPVTYYVAICINLLFFAAFLYGGIAEKFKNKNT